MNINVPFPLPSLDLPDVSLAASYPTTTFDLAPLPLPVSAPIAIPDLPPPTPTKNAKRPANCSSCRLRRIKCIREDGVESCVPCMKKGIACCPMPGVQNGKKTRRRTGKRIEEAKATFGKASESPSSSIYPTPKSSSPEGSPPTQSLVPSSLPNRLTASQLSSEVSYSLIQDFTDFMAHSTSLLHGSGFFKELSSANGQVDLLCPQSQVLAAVVIATAARFSPHPILAGVPAPTADQLKGQFHVGVDLSHYGRQRQHASKALLERALEMMDKNGTLRTPSVKGIAALSLLDALLQDKDKDNKESRVYAGIQILHAKLLMEESTEMELRLNPVRGELAWMALIRDSFNSAATGSPPLCSAEEITLLHENMIADTGLKIPGFLSPASIKQRLSNPILSFVELTLSHVLHLCLLSRDTGKRLTSVKAQRAPRIDIDFLKNFLDNIHLSRTALVEVEERSELARVTDGLLPAGNVLLNRRVIIEYEKMYEVALILLVYMKVETQIRERPDQSVTLQVGIEDMDSAPYLSLLDTHFKELGKVAFQAIRELVKVYREALEKGGVLSMAEFLDVACCKVSSAPSQSLPAAHDDAFLQIMFEDLPHWLPVLVREPVLEEGGNQPDWTYAALLDDLSWLLKTTYAISWAFADIAEYSSLIQRELEAATLRQQTCYTSTPLLATTLCEAPIVTASFSSLDSLPLDQLISYYGFAPITPIPELQ